MPALYVKPKQYHHHRPMANKNPIFLWYIQYFSWCIVLYFWNKKKNWFFEVNFNSICYAIMKKKKGGKKKLILEGDDGILHWKSTDVYNFCWSSRFSFLFSFKLWICFGTIFLYYNHYKCQTVCFCTCKFLLSFILCIQILVILIQDYSWSHPFYLYHIAVTVKKTTLYITLCKKHKKMVLLKIYCNISRLHLERKGVPRLQYRSHK